MVAVKLEGRLGNQLFQYAFIYATAKKLGTSFYLDKRTDNFLLPLYFNVEDDFVAVLDRNIFSIKGYKNIFTVHAKKAFYRLLSTLIFRQKKNSISNYQPAKDFFKQLKNNYLYEGFFHSEIYFEEFKDDIRSCYQIKQEYKHTFEEIKKTFDPLKRKAVIHLRRTDYVDLGIALPVSYYKKAIEIINDKNIEYVFISDSPAFIEAEFSYLSNKYISTHPEIIDLQFMINADICVLSCSSFSWWGAWLNNNKNKQLFAPKYWLGFKEQKEYPVDIANGMNFNWIDV